MKSRTNAPGTHASYSYIITLLLKDITIKLPVVTMFPTKLVVAILAFLFLSSEARKSAAEWKKIDLDAVELDLEFGDDEEFIPTDDQLAAQRLAAGDMSKAKEFNAHIQKR